VSRDRGIVPRTNNVIASEAKQSRTARQDWIASSQVLLAMTVLDDWLFEN
jgi:hypothetical protein